MWRISTVLLAGLCFQFFLLAEEIPANASNADANPTRNVVENKSPARVVERPKAHVKGLRGFGADFKSMMSGFSRTFQQLGNALGKKPAKRETVAVQKQLPLAEIIDDEHVAPAPVNTAATLTFLSAK